MTTGNQAVWTSIQAWAAAAYPDAVVLLGEPRTGMQDDLVAILPQDGEFEPVEMDGPREQHAITLRRYRRWLTDAQDETEIALDDFRAAVQADVFGNFAMGGSTASAVPVEFAWEYGEETMGSIKYRTIEVRVGYRLEETGA